jgi:nicotinamide-nucleotide amidase
LGFVPLHDLNLKIMSSNAVNATIITIGDELLIGQTIDTNSAWMARELNQIGIVVKRRIAVGDNWQDIRDALDEAGRSTPVILITGGLGPTADDITKPLLCDYFGGKLVVDPEALDNVTRIFERLKRPMLERNRKQAEVPDVCTVLQNTRGTAPGMWFEKNECVFISMPGVPHEMKGMMNIDVLPRLQQRFRLLPVTHRTLVTAGVGESFLAERIKAFEESLPDSIKLAYLPNYGMVKLRLSTYSQDPAVIEQLHRSFNTLVKDLSDILVVDEDIPLAQAIGRLLVSKGKTLATAESCTGGYIAHQITSIAGSSDYYLGSVVAYANEMKNALLGVSQATLQQNGAVSEATVREMASGVIQRTGADYAIATSGIMGPGGGSEEKPVGTVWIAVADKNTIRSEKIHVRFDRIRNIELTATHAFNALRKFISDPN